MAKSGWVYSYGMGFWGANGHDGIWHVALAESLAKFSFENPVMSGESLKNYHVGFDLLLAFFTKITGIPTVNLYFQVFPALFALLVGILVYKFVKEWTADETSSLWSVFFTYFGGSAAWLFGRGESAFWSQQAISSLINPPYVMSLIFILAGLINLIRYIKNKSVRNLILTSVFFGLLFQIKIYAGLLVLAGLFAVSVYEAFRQKHYYLGKVFLLTGTISVLLFVPFNSSGGSLIVWQPFWFLETMMGLSDRFDWQKFYSAMTNYRAADNYPKASLAYLVAFGIFLIGNMGSRILFLPDWIKIKKSVPDSVKLFLVVIVCTGIVIPMLFLQKGTPWNTIQFFYYSLFFSGIFAGISVSRYSFPLLKALVILITIPTTFFTLKDVYIPSRPPSMVPNTELEALRFLKTKSEGVVLTYPFDEEAAKREEASPPRPLRLYVSTGYVSALSGKPTFLEDEVNLDITGYDWKNRRLTIEDWYKESDVDKARDFLLKNNIKYIYWVKGQRALLGEGQLGIEKIYENNDVAVFENGLLEE